MRIVGGDFGGRVLRTPKTGMLRPTQDRVREAVFNIIQCETAGADFLDLFAGTGAVGIEAISRGAASVTFVEADRRHAETLRQNISEIAGLAAGRCHVHVASAYRWVASYSGPGFSIVFADPPYALGEENGYTSFLEDLASHGVARPGALFIAEMTAAQDAETAPGWTLLRDRKYGKTRICIWRREGPNK